MKKFITIVIALISVSAFSSFNKDKVKRMFWNNLEVIWLEDERFPTYNAMFYFADGALSDGVREKGATEAAFDLLSYGTRRFSRQDIADNLDFFGVSYGASVTHEYSLFTVQGLTKDIAPTIKKICHLFQDATYPKAELKVTKKRAITSINSKVNDPGTIASMAFREMSLAGSPFAYPVSGKKKDIVRFNTKMLRKKMDYFNEKVKKRIYLSGPKSVLSIEDIINKECGWTGKADFERTAKYEPIKSKGKPNIYLVTVPKANQAQVRIGKFINQEDLKRESDFVLASEFLGGGFTSRLMRVLRNKHGLTYSVSAFAGSQKVYGRAGIATFTKSSTVEKLLSETKNTIEEIESGNFDEVDLSRSKGFISGSFPFRFETSDSLLRQIVLLDHERKSLSSLDSFKDEIKSINKKHLQSLIKSFYHWNDQTIVVVGEKSLLKQLTKFGDVKVLSYRRFL